MKKCSYNMGLLEKVLETLLQGRILPMKHRDHALTGNFSGFRECHILPDWLLIYQIDRGMLILVASRTGTQSDLFKKMKGF